MFPPLSPSICTSTCLAFLIYLSKKDSEFPKAFSASLFPSKIFFSTSSMLLISLIPLPPPPQEALSISGKPIFFAILTSSSGLSGNILLAGITGTPASSAIFLALALFPNFSILSAVGPINFIPAKLHSFANSGFSDKRPYPG